MSEHHSAIYRGSVYDIADPEARGRLRLLVPQVMGDAPTTWAEPTLPPAFDYAPTVGDRVWVLFEGGDINRPTFISHMEVTEQDILPNAITEDKIAPEAVGSEKIAPGSIGTDKIVPGSVTVELLDPTIELGGGGGPDGNPPASSPAASVLSGIRSLFIRWTPVTNADPVTYDVHLSTVSGFATGVANLVGSTAGALFLARTLTDGTPLTPGVTYYAKIVARDADGAALPGAEGSGVPILVETVDIADVSVTNAKIGASAVDVSKLADGSVSAAKLVDGAVGTTKLVDGSVLEAKLASNAVTLSKIADGAVTEAKTTFYTALANAVTNAQNTADSAQAAADGAISTYYSPEPPWADNTVQPAEKLGDLWYDTDTDIAHRWNGTIWAVIQDNAISQALAAAQNAQATADGKITTFYAALAAPPVAEALGDLWVVTGSNLIKRWDGTAWVDLPVGSDAIQTGAVTNAKIGNLAVDTAKLADGSVSAAKIIDGVVGTTKLVDGAVLSTKLADNAVTLSKVATGAVDNTKLVDGAVSASKLNVAIGGGNRATNSSFEVDQGDGFPGNGWVRHTGSLSDTNGWILTTTDKRVGTKSLKIEVPSTSPIDAYSSQIIDLPVGRFTASYWVQRDGVTRATSVNGGSGLNIDPVGGTGAVLGAASNWQGGTSIDVLSTGTNAWRREWVTFDVTAAGQVRFYLQQGYSGTVYGVTRFDAFQVEEGDVPTAYAPKPDEILPGTITTTEIANDSITTPKLIAGAVTTAKVAADAITANEIAAGAVTATEIAAGAITTTKLAAGAVTANEIAAGAITTTKLAAGAVTANEIAAGAVTAVKIAADSITANQIAAGAIGAEELAANSVVAGKIAANAVTATTIAAGAITVGSAQTTFAAGYDPLTKEGVTASNTNPYFSAWPVGDVRPTGYIAAGAVGSPDPTRETAIVRTAPHAIRWNVPAGVSTYIFTPVTTIADPGPYVTVTTDVYLASGDFGGAGILVRWNNTAGSPFDATIRFGIDIPTPVVGKWYRITKVVPRPANFTGTFRDIHFWPMAGWTGLGTITAKDIIFDHAALWPSSAEEVSAYVAGGWKTPGTTTIDGGKITADSVSATQIAAGAITTTKLAAGAVTANEIAAGAVTAVKIAADSITANQIAAGAIGAEELAANSVVAGKIAADAVTATTIAAGSVTTLKIAANAVTASEIAANTITANEIAAGAITANEIAASTITGTQLTGQAIDGMVITGATVQTAATGRRVINDGDGLRLIDVDEATIVTLPTDASSPAVFKGDAEINRLTVSEFTTLNTSALAEGAVLTLQFSLGNPSVPPTLEGNNYTTLQFGTSSNTSWSKRNGVSEVVGSYVYTAGTSTGDKNVVVERWNHSTGAYVDRALNLTLPANYTLFNYVNVASDGNYLFVIYAQYHSSTAYWEWHIRTITTAATPVLVKDWIWEYSPADSNRMPGIAYDSAADQVVVAQSSPNGQYTRVRRLDAPQLRTSTTSSIAGGLFFDVTDWHSGGVSSLMVGNADYGVKRYVLLFQTSSSAYSFYVYSTTGTRVTDEEWPHALSGISPTGAYWHPTENFFYLIDRNGLRRKFQGSGFNWLGATTREFEMGYTWYKSTAPVTETLISPTAKVTSNKRARIKVTVPTLPASGGVDNWRGYARIPPAPGTVETSGYGNKYALNFTVTYNPAFMVTIVTSPGNDPTASTFGSGSSSLIKTAGVRSDGAPKFEVKGDGSGRFDGLLPPGSIIEYGGTTEPTGWLLCEGQNVSTLTYPDLFSAIGHVFNNGVSPGTNLFKLPDFRDRKPVGKSTTKALGSAGGSETSTLSLANMPAHNHGSGGAHTHPLRQGSSGSTNNNQVGPGNAFLKSDDQMNPVAAGAHTHNTEGSGTAFNTMDPYQAVNFLIKI